MKVVLRRKQIFAAAVFLSLIFFSSVFAKDINFEAVVNKNKVFLGSSVQLSLSFYGAQSVSIPDLPDIEGFDRQYIGPSTRMSIVNGRVSSSITHIYILHSLKTGVFTIPSLTAVYKGRSYTSNPITLKVVHNFSNQSPVQGSYGSEAADRSLKDKIFLVIEADKKKAYINEIIFVTIKLYVNKLAVRDIEYPEFCHEGFSLEQFTKPRQYRDIFDGVLYDIIEFNTNVFGLRSGELKLGPAELKCNLLVKKKSKKRPSSFSFDDDFSSFFDSDIFGRYERHSLDLKSSDTRITVMALPHENKPNDFDGALGNYRFEIEVNPKEVKVGDPITLKMIIAGRGNFKTVNCPRSDFDRDFKVYKPEIEQSHAVKVFEQVIIPKKDTVREVPGINFSFFDTKSGKYKTITRGPVSIKVNPLPKGEELKIVDLSREIAGIGHGKEILGRDIIYIKDRLGRLRKKDSYLYRNKIFLLFQLIVLISLISVLAAHKRAERFKADVRYARGFRAPKKAKKGIKQAQQLLNEGKTREFYDTVSKTLQEYLGDKFHLSMGGITQNFSDEVLKPKGINDSILDKVRDIFKECDVVRFAPFEFTGNQTKIVLRSLAEVVDYLEGEKL